MSWDGALPRGKGQSWLPRPGAQSSKPDSFGGKRSEGPVRRPAGQAFLAAPAVPPGLRARGGRAHSPPKAREQKPGRGRGPDPPPGNLAAAPPSQPAVQTVPGYRGAARAGRGRCARGRNGRLERSR
ncbi:basic salivary proline-rich protein 3-like [Lutra lutra]|uniref:basic salivary proline-rich protein 3-like n=1 Tax=Lutra lutra TaxID=9657 RepID=UPI001FD259E1|nr:basic salivary proline-rich protein 3-like [Lutra lutra]